MLDILYLADKIFIQRQVLKVLQAIEIFDFADFIMLQVEDSQLFKHLKILDLFNIEPFKVNGLELEDHGDFFLLRESISHAIVQRSLCYQVDANLIVLIEFLVVVFFRFMHFLLFNCLRLHVIMLRRR